jgi:drug/metabolite transporter (DMT)-like permease
MSPNILFATALLLLGGAGYGSMFAANKIVADAGFPVLAYLFWQSILGAAFVFGLHAVRWRRPNTRPRAIAHYVGSACFGMLIPTGVLAFVADVLPASVLTLTMTLIPSLTYAFAFVLRVERLRWLSLGAILLGLGGVLMIVLPQGSLPDASAAIWILPALIAPISAATNNLIVATLRPPESDSLTLGGSVLLGGAVITFPVAALSGDLVVFWQSSAVLTGVLWAAVAQAVGFFCLYEVIRRAGPVFFSQISYVIVACGIGWGFALFSERPSVWIWGAVALMTLGLGLANTAVARTSPTSEGS